MFCIHCGASMKDSAQFCIMCGKKNKAMSDDIGRLTKSPTEQPGIPRGQQKPMTRRAKTPITKLLLIGIPVLVVIILATAAMFALLGPGQTDTDSLSAGQHETTEDTEDTEDTEETEDTEREQTEVQVEESLVMTTETTSSDAFGIESTVGEQSQPFDVQPRIQAVPDGEVENEVLHVREVWNAYRTSIEDTSFPRIDIEQGVIAYSNGSEIVTIEVAAGYLDSTYARIYTYENGALIFAFFYSDTEENRLYIKSDQLFRWRYTLGSNDPINYDNTADNLLYLNWESLAIEEGNRLLLLAISDADLSDETSPDLQIVTGQFQGIEWGDFMHISIKGDDGIDYSFFVLQSFDIDLESLEIGQDVKVAWQNSDVQLGPPFGIKNVDQLIDIELLVVAQ